MRGTVCATAPRAHLALSPKHLMASRGKHLCRDGVCVAITAAKGKALVQRWCVLYSQQPSTTTLTGDELPRAREKLRARSWF